MTVCIASFCHREKCIVAVEDSMLSMSEMSADSAAIKHKAIGNSWVAMLAGGDVSPSVPILRDVRKALGKPSSESLDEIVSAFQSAYKKQIVQAAETSILSRFDINMAEFRSNGLASFGPELFTRLIYEIEQVTLDLTFLVCGFDQKEPHIFTIHGKGDATYFDLAGFWAIGSGQTSALATLFAAQSSVIFKNLPDVLWMVSKAKFNAETALGVGKRTTGLVLKENLERYVIQSEKMKEVKDLWEKQRQPDCPTENDVPLSKILKQAEDEFKNRSGSSGG
ncbi:MAG: hypothetical protein ABSB66_03925 [Candidatus Acidiferrales bacterium]|jgi:ATP-dependent protease HslVU (ClpYQ) peptidase subunit